MQGILAWMPVLLRGRAASCTNSSLCPCHPPNETGSKHAGLVTMRSAFSELLNQKSHSATTFGNSASCAQSTAARVVSDKTNPGIAQIVVVAPERVIARMPVRPRAQAVCQVHLDPAKPHGTQGNNRSPRPDARSSQACCSHKWDIS